MKTLNLRMTWYWQLTQLLNALNTRRSATDEQFIKAEIHEDGQIFLCDKDGESILADHVVLRFEDDKSKAN